MDFVIVVQVNSDVRYADERLLRKLPNVAIAEQHVIVLSVPVRIHLKYTRIKASHVPETYPVIIIIRSDIRIVLVINV